MLEILKQYLLGVLSKATLKNIAGVIGFIESLFPVIRELLMVITRICTTIIPGDTDDKIVAKIKAIFDEIEKVFEKVKDFFLDLTAG